MLNNFNRKFIFIFLLIFILTNIFVILVGAEDPEEIWQIDTDNKIETSPYVDNEGIYFGNNGEKVFAFSHDGEEIWEQEVNGYVKRKPAGDSNTVYITTSQGYLYAINKENGNINWELEVEHGTFMGPPRIEDDIIYVGSDYSLTAVSLDGEELWTYDIGNVNYIPITYAVEDDLIYVGTINGFLNIIDNEGNLQEEIEISLNESLEKPLIADDGTIYISCTDGKIYAVNSEGDIKWEFDTGRKINLTQTFFDKQGNIYVAFDYKVFSINREGQERWSYALDIKDFITAGITITKNDEERIIFGSDNGNIYFMDNAGELLGTFNTEAPVHSTPVVYDNSVYFGNDAGKLFAISY